MYKVFVLSSCIVFYFVVFGSILSLLDSSISAQYVNVTADNTFELYVDNVRLIGPICPDNNTGMVGTNPTGQSCFWGTATRVHALNLRAGSIVAVHGRNADGNNTNPLLGGSNPGAFILTVTGADGTVCSNSDLGASWRCTDNLALLQYTGSSTPSDSWTDPTYDTPAPLWGGPLNDLGANVAGSWANLTTEALANGSWPNSIWYSVIPGGPGPVPGIALTAHWVWYRYDMPNTDIYCRLTVGSDYNCTLPSSIPSLSSSPNPVAAGGGSNTGTIVGAVVGSVVGVVALAGLAAAAAAAGTIAYKKLGGAPSSTGLNTSNATFNEVKQSELYTDNNSGGVNPLFN